MEEIPKVNIDQQDPLNEKKKKLVNSGLDKGKESGQFRLNSSQVDSNGVFRTSEERKLSHLNAYSFYPNTVPPFALDEQFKKAKTINRHVSDADSMLYKPNDISTSQDNHWGNFASNIGSNVAYTDDQRINLKSSLALSRTNTRNSNVTESTNSSTLNEHEKYMIRKEILHDLSDDWAGEERLKAIYNLPMDSDFKFKTQKDRKEWANYVSRAKEVYYGKGFVKRKGTEQDNGLRTSNDIYSNRSHRIDWLEEFNRDKERWHKLKQKKMRKWMPKMNRLLIENQYLPLAFRIMIVVLSLASLALAVRIFQNSDARIEKIDATVSQQPSTVMAICVNSIAIFYTIYIALDEFSGKPLGLRNPLSKLRLILLDLLFIIFSSANLALAFNTRYDKEWVCTSNYMDDGLYKYPRISYICRKQKALSSFLFVLLFMWVIIFIISIIRVVEKVSSNLSAD